MSIHDMTVREAEADDVPVCDLCGSRLEFCCWLNDWTCFECSGDNDERDEEE